MRKRGSVVVSVGLLILGLCGRVGADSATHGLPDQTRQRQIWTGDLLGKGYVHSGCLPAVPGASLTLSVPACEAYVEDTTTGEILYASEGAKAVGPLTGGSGTYWLALHRDATSTVASWTRQVGTKLLWRSWSTALSSPPTPAGGILLTSVTVAGGVITAVQDRRIPASYARTGAADIQDPLYGAVGDGTTDDTVAVQAALNSNLGLVLCPSGSYKITATLTITRAIHFRGIGPRPGSQQTSPDERWRGCALNHAFNGTFIDIPGILNDVNGPQGTILENMILRQVYGDGSAAAGIAINVVKGGDAQYAAWVRIVGISTQYDQGNVNDWTYAVVMDGTASTVHGVGSRDHSIHDCWFLCYTHATGCVLLKAVQNATISNTLLQGDKANLEITGTDADHMTSNSSMSNVKILGALMYDWAQYNTCVGCGPASISFTTHSTGNFVNGNISLFDVTMPAGSTNNLVQSVQGIYFNGNNSAYYTLKAPDGYATRVGIDGTPGEEAFTGYLSGGTLKWKVGRAGDDSFYLVHATLGGILTASTTGRINTIKASAKRWTDVSFAVPDTTIDCSVGDFFDLTVTNNSNFNIVNPSNKSAGQTVVITVKNTSGGAMGAITWGTQYLLAGAFTNPGNGNNRSITFITTSSGAFLREVSRANTDVSN